MYRLRSKTIIASILSVVVGLADYSPADEVSLPAKEKLHLFLLIGQSNMAGRGVVEDQDRKTHPRVLVLNKELKWVPAVDPLHWDKPGIVGTGLGKTFATIVADANPDITVGLVPCAVGGSPIASWEPGGFHSQTKTHPYDDALPRIRAAAKSGVFHGILFHQGESDAQKGLAEVYETALHELIGRVRNELGSAQIPFIAGQMGRFPERPWDEWHQLVDKAHRSLPEKVARTAFVESVGLKHKGDQVHFDAASYRELGKRYAAAYLAMQPTAIPN